MKFPCDHSQDRVRFGVQLIKLKILAPRLLFIVFHLLHHQTDQRNIVNSVLILMQLLYRYNSQCAFIVFGMFINHYLESKQTNHFYTKLTTKLNELNIYEATCKIDLANSHDSPAKTNISGPGCCANSHRSPCVDTHTHTQHYFTQILQFVY